MSENLKRVAKRLLKYLKESKYKLKASLKKANSSVVKALAEISLNIKHGVVKIKRGVKASIGFIKKLADKGKSLPEKKRLLRAKLAVDIVKTIILAAAPILTTICVNG